MTQYQINKLAKKKKLFAELKAGLPHLYGVKLYQWQKDFIETKSELAFLTAANQIGKSTAMILKMLRTCTTPKLWPELWPAKPDPLLMWYLYPSREVATLEWKTKWLPLMPKGPYQDHPIYGWEAKFEGDYIASVQFKSGPLLVFKTYGQRTMVLQTASVWVVACDEELPEMHYSELSFRIEGTQGYFWMVFTATLGQQMWLRAMEGKGETELFPEAFKRTVSMEDCRVYADGSPGPYDDARIAKAIARCKNKAEVDRRVHGRFVKDEGRKYVQYDPTRHLIKPYSVPREWSVYGAVDIGSGGNNHKPACLFLAVRPDRRYAVVFKGWKGDDGADYTAEDILQKFMQIRAGDMCTMQIYDQNARDFFVIATRMGENFVNAEKHHDAGEGAVNTLFKNGMLFVFDDSENEQPELHKLGSELMTVPIDKPKNKLDDDMADCLRYICATVPWDWEALSGIKKKEERDEARRKRLEAKPETEAEAIARRIKERRSRFVTEGQERGGGEWSELDAEVAEYNQLYGGHIGGY